MAMALNRWTRLLGLSGLCCFVIACQSDGGNAQAGLTVSARTMPYQTLADIEARLYAEPVLTVPATDDPSSDSAAAQFTHIDLTALLLNRGGATSSTGQVSLIAYVHPVGESQVIEYLHHSATQAIDLERSWQLKIPHLGLEDPYQNVELEIKLNFEPDDPLKDGNDRNNSDDLSLRYEDAQVVHQCGETPVREAPAQRPPLAWGQIGFDADHIAERGSGIRIALLDTGYEHCHPDLSGSILANRSYHISLDQRDPYNWQTGGDHGTAVGSLIAASHNAIGFLGLAPQAKILSFNVLSYPQRTSSFVAAMGLGSDDHGIDVRDVQILNVSFGSTPEATQNVASSIATAVAHGADSLRDGKGALYVKAVGNSFNDCASLKLAISQSIGCIHGSIDPYNNMWQPIVVAAVDAADEPAYYSSSSAALWIAAPGGIPGFDAGLVVADQHGCNRGWNSEVSTIDPDCDYVRTLAGTSFSAPITSAAIALMLEANPHLHWNDVKYILATTAQNDGANSEHHDTSNIELSDGSYQASMGWIRNGAGLFFHHRLGFGVLDVGQAVAMAKTFEPTWTQYHEHRFDSQQSMRIADFSVQGASSSIRVDVSAAKKVLGTVACVAVEHPFPHDLGVELQSPSGTRTILNPIFNLGLIQAADGLKDATSAQGEPWCLAASAFFMESAAGTWTLRVIDANRRNTGYLDHWLLKLYL